MPLFFYSTVAILSGFISSFFDAMMIAIIKEP
jgi:hypothetical protein